jgi:hypothetical protein
VRTADPGEHALARRLWQHVEVVHAVVYFAPEVAERVAATGIEGWWAGYVAGRAAPLGQVSPEVVEALFHGFSPSRIRRGVPGAWSFVTPAELVELRRDAVAAALRVRAGDHVVGPDARRISELLDEALQGADVGGRALFAAHLATTAPADPVAAMWHRCTLLREHRGDGHVAALVAADLDGAESNRLAVARGAVPPGDAQRRNRGWSEQEWDAAGVRLRDRGVLDASGALTDAGRALVDRVEHDTDAAAACTVASLGAGRTLELLDLLVPVVDAIVASGVVGYPNAMGLTRPTETEPRNRRD